MSLHFHNFIWIPSVHIHYTASAFKGQLQGVVGCVLAVKNNTSQIIYTFADLKYNLYLGCIFTYFRPNVEKKGLNDNLF